MGIWGETVWEESHCLIQLRNFFSKTQTNTSVMTWVNIKELRMALLALSCFYKVQISWFAAKMKWYERYWNQNSHLYLSIEVRVVQKKSSQLWTLNSSYVPILIWIREYYELYIRWWPVQACMVHISEWVQRDMLVNFQDHSLFKIPHWMACLFLAVCKPNWYWAEGKFQKVISMVLLTKIKAFILTAIQYPSYPSKRRTHYLTKDLQRKTGFSNALKSLKTWFTCSISQKGLLSHHGNNLQGGTKHLRSRHSLKYHPPMITTPNCKNYGYDKVKVLKTTTNKQNKQKQNNILLLSAFPS